MIKEAIRSLVGPLAKREYEGRASFLANRFMPLFDTKAKSKINRGRVAKLWDQLKTKLYDT